MASDAFVMNSCSDPFRHSGCWRSERWLTAVNAAVLTLLLRLFVQLLLYLTSCRLSALSVLFKYYQNTKLTDILVVVERHHCCVQLYALSRICMLSADLPARRSRHAIRCLLPFACEIMRWSWISIYSHIALTSFCSNCSSQTVVKFSTMRGTLQESTSKDIRADCRLGPCRPAVSGDCASASVTKGPYFDPMLICLSHAYKKSKKTNKDETKAIRVYMSNHLIF